MAAGVSGSGGTSTAPVASANTVSPSSGVWHGRMVWASPSWAAMATRRHPAGLSAASVATTAMVVLSGLTRVSSRRTPRSGRPAARRARTPRSGRPSTAARWRGRRRCRPRSRRRSRRPSPRVVERHRRGPHAALEHARAGADPGADGADGNIGAGRLGRRRPELRGRPALPAADGQVEDRPPRARWAPGRRPSPRRGRVPRATASRRRRRPVRTHCRRVSTTASTWRTLLAGSSRSVSRLPGAPPRHVDRADGSRRGQHDGRAASPSRSRAWRRRRSDGDGRRGSRRHR